MNMISAAVWEVVAAVLNIGTVDVHPRGICLLGHALELQMNLPCWILSFGNKFSIFPWAFHYIGRNKVVYIGTSIVVAPEEVTGRIVVTGQGAVKSNVVLLREDMKVFQRYSQFFDTYCMGNERERERESLLINFAEQ